MAREFDKLSDRKRYGSHRRSDLLIKYISEDPTKVEWMISYEVDVESLLKRKLGYKEWDDNWDVGLHLKDGITYLMLSNKNQLGSFQELEKVKYSKDLDAATWLLDCLYSHKAYKLR